MFETLAYVMVFTPLGIVAAYLTVKLCTYAFYRARYLAQRDNNERTAKNE